MRGCPREPKVVQDSFVPDLEENLLVDLNKRGGSRFLSMKGVLERANVVHRLALPWFGLVVLSGVFLMTESLSAGWVQVWGDEFDGSGAIDASKWNFETFEPGANNNELQKYTGNRLENCRRENGVLVIEGRRDWWREEGSQTNYEYTSARIQTAGKFSMKYGKIEMRALMPWANGGWPAFWMMPQKGLYGGWPDSGEIDILEYVGWENDVAHVNAHTKDYNFLLGTNYGWSGRVEGMESSYHTYTIEWWYDRIDYYIDGVWRFGFANEDVGPGQWPFNTDFFLILNHAIGGDWGGLQGIDTDAYDTAGDNYGVGYFVDWVRAYQWEMPEHEIPAHVEAELYQGYGGDIREEKCEDLGAGWHVGFIDSGDYMQYTLRIPAAGWYQVDYRVASNSRRSLLTLGKGGVDIQSTVIPNTGGWQNWQTVRDLVWLEAGTQTFDIYATIGGWNLNHFKISAAPPSLKIEAEYYRSMSGVEAEETEDVGGGLNIGFIETGDSMSYEVEVPETGNYTLTYRLASISSQGIITLRGNGLSLQETSVLATGGWQNWRTVRDVVFLEKGGQTLTLQADGGGWNLNWWGLEQESPDYNKWALAYGRAAYEERADSDDDGRTNWAEYAFGTDPLSKEENPHRLHHAGMHLEQGTFPSFTYTRRQDLSHLRYSLETSEDLRSWMTCLREDGGDEANTYTMKSQSADLGDGSQRLTLFYNRDISQIASGRLFFRVSVQEN